MYIIYLYVYKHSWFETQKSLIAPSNLHNLGVLRKETHSAVLYVHINAWKVIFFSTVFEKINPLPNLKSALPKNLNLCYLFLSLF